MDSTTRPVVGQASACSVKDILRMSFTSRLYLCSCTVKGRTTKPRIYRVRGLPQHWGRVLRARRKSCEI